jgi:AcrR family transcriptional regulator
LPAPANVGVTIERGHKMPVTSKSSATTDKIIEAASKLFSRQGYHGTSTRQIAQLAGVGENTLFRQFEHKEEIFWSTLRYHSSGLKLRRDLVEELAQGEPPEVVLPKLLNLLSEMLIYKPELLRMIAIAFLELHWRADVFSHEFLSPAFSQVSRYLEINIKDGKLRGLDPTILTSALLMTSLMHPGIERLIGRSGPGISGKPDAANSYASFWLDLLVPGLVPNSDRS